MSRLKFIALVIINKRCRGRYSWDERTDRILKEKAYFNDAAIVRNICHSCGANTHQSLDSKWKPVCQYCGSVLNVTITKKEAKNPIGLNVRGSPSGSESFLSAMKLINYRDRKNKREPQESNIFKFLYALVVTQNRPLPLRSKSEQEDERRKRKK